MIKEIKMLSDLYTFHIQKFTWRIRLDQSISKAYAKLNIALEMGKGDRIVSNRGEGKEGGEAAAPAALVGTTGAALLGKHCSFLIAIVLKPFLAGSSSSKCGFLRSTGQRGPWLLALHGSLLCLEPFWWRQNTREQMTNRKPKCCSTGFSGLLQS